ncbi:MAG: Omp28-related outer membrane protein [Bacteroidales bacterium]|nr:Omp28-related outer membrane protein [Bacteroidales bacterium]
MILPLAALCCCGNPSEETPVETISGEVVLLADKDQVRSDGTDAVTFKVEVTDENGAVHDVTEHSEIYLNYQKTPLESNVFTTTEEGEYVFYAIYGYGVTEDVLVTAINDVPELPADPQESNLSFRHRMLLVQHTGATCSNCPRMMESLKKLSEDSSYNGLYHHVASHSYNGGQSDAAYSEAARDLSMAYNISGLYPMLTFNLTTTSTGTDVSEIKSQIDLLKKEKADAGIAAAAEFSGKEVIVNVEVKSAKENNYRVAAWLLEDDIYSLQSGMYESWHNTHHNALRYAAGQISQLSFAGEKLGSLAQGAKASKVLVLPLEEGWVAENCKVLVIVTAADANGNYDVANCALCQIGETINYDYK